MSVRADVDRGLEIVAEIEKLEVELKAIDERLKTAALNGEQVELKDAAREGRQYRAAGSEQIVPVIITSDMLVGSFAAGSDTHEKIRLAAGHGKTDVDDFFKRVVKYENRFDSGKKFRARADELLTKDAPAFITACLSRDKDGIPKTAIKVMWQESEVQP